MSPARRRAVLLATLAGLAAILLATAIPGIFTVDEDSYIATVVGLRDGTLAVSNTDGLSPSRELLFFDPASRSRPVVSTPVVSNAPPLYAPFALPFASLGPRGLILLQVLAFVACAWLVFGYTRRETGRDDLAWLALGTLVLASFTLEYAQGIWPHMLSAALGMGAVDLASRVRAGRTPWLAAAAGVCAGLAAGVRYQNIAFAALVGAGLLWTARPRRVHALAAFVLGCALPLAASGAMNASRLGSWNPVSKGPSYMKGAPGRTTSQKAAEAVVATWARVVDYSAWPPPVKQASEIETWLHKNPRTGAFLVQGALKKSLIQSAPWVIVPLLALLLAWFRRSAFAPGSRRELGAFSLVVAGVLGVFAVYGFREDGWCFNQRYLLELMPILAVAFAMSLGDRRPPWRSMAIGAGVAIALGAAVFALDPRAVSRQLLLMKLPIVLAVGLGAAWLLERARRVRFALLGVLLGACLGWATIVHLGDDLRASRALRERNARQLAVFRQLVPAGPPAALFAYGGNKDAFGPLLLERDLVIVDAWIDRGEDAPTLVNEFLARGRAVYVMTPYPRSILAAMVAGHRFVEIPGAHGLVEVR